MTVMTEQKTISLSRGELTLRYQTSADYQLDELLGFAERINPKRAFLFVSKVLGRHIPVSPDKIRQAFTQLATLIPDDLPEPIVVIGMAETAVGLSAGVHQVLQARYPQAILLNSTRHAQAAALFATFSEDHSHASVHLIYQSDDSALQANVENAKTLIMVDDEASTGNTCQNVVNALRQAGMSKLTQVHLATLVDWSLDKKLGKKLGKTDRVNAPAVTMPNVSTTEAGSQPLLPTGNWGRQPTRDSTSGLDFLLRGLHHTLSQRQLTLASFAYQKILVLGSNEFVWLPLLLAERLAQYQADVKFSALTRSPIAIHADSAVTSVIKFFDHYGLGMTNFVYNVTPEAWDWVLLCVETPQDSVDEIWQRFDNVMVISPSSEI